LLFMAQKIETLSHPHSAKLRNKKIATHTKKAKSENASSLANLKTQQKIVTLKIENAEPRHSAKLKHRKKCENAEPPSLCKAQKPKQIEIA